MDFDAPSSAPPLRWPLATLAGGLLAAVLAGLWQSRANDERIAVKLAHETVHAADRLGQTLLEYERILLGLRGQLMATGNGDVAVTREQFRRYVQALDLRRELPGVYGLGFSRLVPRAQEQAYIERQRREGAPGFRILELAPHDGDHIVVEMIEPLQANAQALGMDSASEPARREAALAAQRSAQPRLTGPITLLQVRARPQQSVLLLLPVYREGTLPEEARRAGQLQGWVHAALVVDEVLQAIDVERDGLALEVVDAPRDNAAQRLFVSGDWLSDRALPQEQTAVELFGRTWQVRLQALPGFAAGLNLSSPYQVAAEVAGLGALLALVVYLGAQQAARRQALEHERAQAAAVMASAHDAIIRHTPQDFILDWNAAAERLLGWRLDEVRGRPLMDLIVPAQLRGQAAEIVARVQRGEDVAPIETVRLDRQEQPIAVSLSVVGVRGAQGRIIGSATTLRDIRESQAAREQVQRLNEALQQRLQEQQQQAAALREVTARDRAILASAASAIIALDLQARVTAFNPAECTMFRVSQRQALGRSVAEFCDPDELHYKALYFPQEVKDNAGQMPHALRQGLDTPASATQPGAQRNEWTYLRADGTRFPGLLSLSVLRGDHDEAVGFLAVITDLSERVQLEHALRQHTAELLALRQREQAVVDSAGTAIIATDLAGRITVFNPAAEVLLRLPAAQALGRSELEFRDHEEMRLRLHLYPREVLEHTAALPDWLAQAARDALAAPREHDGNPRSEWTYVRADGSRVPVLASISLTRDETGLPSGFLAILTDMTERRALEEQLRERTRQAESANAAKTTFLANMSHEIRTPLNAVIGLSQLLQTTVLDERQQRFVLGIHAAGEQLLGLLNDILDLSKIEAGEMRLELQPLDLEHLLQQMMQLAQAQATQKGLQLHLDTGPGVPQYVLGDAVRIRQVLMNLMSNALKFTASGSVTLRVSAAASPESDTASRAGLRFEVVDTGIGIPQEKQAAIFDPFTQADDSTTRRFGGTGLGLSIVRRLVTLMAGRIELVSAQGQGSTFSVTLPLQGLPEQSPEPRA
ncbi:CHASE domain-containing protein [Azohydromonas lata]|uniref:histidine kinase n=1 Tax=Azohydromonas lata TaxID=45677 RepID=A0ABU5I9M0_9BURK|nr:CHASE domain-containing protein [Azohydromonas lata]MDZ5455801.1 CHASE domain-containing protein [Azohydromonas lata]